MSEHHRAIIVGAGGQDGMLLQRSLHAKGVESVGISRHSIHYPYRAKDAFSILDEQQVKTLFIDYRPERIYYLAAHHTSSQIDDAVPSSQAYEAFHHTHVVGLHHFLEAIRIIRPEVRLFYASSSLIFDGSIGPKQTEETPFGPVGFYGLTKLQGMLLCRHYRREYDVFASCGILFSHESIHRPETYLSKKIISAVHAISRGVKTKVTIGNLDAVNDWGYAADYVEAFQSILTQRTPNDYIVSTGEGHTVRQFAQLVCEYFNLSLSDCVVEDKRLPLRRTGPRIGDYTKLRRDTGWTPTRSFRKMVETLIDEYLQAYQDRTINTDSVSGAQKPSNDLMS